MVSLPGPAWVPGPRGGGPGPWGLRDRSLRVCRVGSLRGCQFRVQCWGLHQGAWDTWCQLGFFVELKYTPGTGRIRKGMKGDVGEVREDMESPD